TLEPSSRELIENLVRHRFPQLSDIDARTIAEFSGGNARIAIALAGTIGDTETIAGLTDEDLFRRLFEQRHAANPSLYLAAQACSLVYSFQGVDVSDGQDAELVWLVALVGQTSQELYRYVAELRRCCPRLHSRPSNVRCSSRMAMSPCAPVRTIFTLFVLWPTMPSFLSGARHYS